MNISNYFHTMRNLMEIKRYQNKISLVPRTIAEHKFGYSKISYMLGYWEKRLGNSLDMSELLQRSILSGTIKAITGDIQNNTISATPNMRSTLLDTYDKFYDSSYRPLLPQFISGDIKSKVLYAKDESIEGQVLRVASLVNRFLECFDEVSLGNGFKFEKILEDTTEELLSIDSISAKLLLSEMPKSMSYHLPKFKSELKENKRFVYSNLKAKDIFDFDYTFYSYITEIRGLMGVVRYQNIFKHRIRSVAEHQWFVSLVSLFIYYYLGNSEVDLEDLLVRSLFHDDIELYTGDIISGTKNANSDTKQEVLKVESKYYDSIYCTLVPEDLNGYLKSMVLDPKSDSIEGRILSVSDIVDTVYESQEEIILGNLENFCNIRRTGLEKLDSYKEEFPFLKELIPAEN